MDSNRELTTGDLWILRQLRIIRSQEEQLDHALALPYSGRAEKIRVGMEQLNSRIERLERVLDPLS